MAVEILNALIQKGLRRKAATARRLGPEILNALIQKGLRQMAVTASVYYSEILNALIQKGLRQGAPAYVTSNSRNTECPDSKGIKTLS